MRLPADLLAALDARAKAGHVTRTEAIRAILSAELAGGQSVADEVRALREDVAALRRDVLRRRGKE